MFVDAPHILERADLHTSGHTVNELNASGASTGAGEEAEDPEKVARGWWTTKPGQHLTIGLDETLEYVKEVLKKDTYDGVFGFRYVLSIPYECVRRLRESEVRERPLQLLFQLWYVHTSEFPSGPGADG